MEYITHLMHELIDTVVPFLAAIVEIFGVVLIILAIIKCFNTVVLKYRFNFDEIHEDTELGKDLSVALEVLFTAEILNTIVATTLDSLFKVILLVLIRVFMVFALHWEGKHKGHHHE